MHASTVSLFRLALMSALVCMSMDARAQLAPTPSPYVRDSQGVIVRTSDVGDPRIGKLCVRTGYWTPAQATPECEIDLISTPPSPRVCHDPLPPPVSRGPDQPYKTTYSADAFFDFDKSVIKPAGKRALGALVEKLKNVDVDVIIVVGHTDSVGSVTYNNKLSLRRAEAVKAYLASQGVDARRIYVEGKGKSQPIADNKTAEGRAKNRRVEVEVVLKGK